MALQHAVPCASYREDHLARLVKIQPEIVPLRPRLNVDQFGMSCDFIASRDNQICIVREFTYGLFDFFSACEVTWSLLGTLISHVT